MRSYANILEEGIGVEADAKEAMRYYKLAVDFGDMEAIPDYM